MRSKFPNAEVIGISEKRMFRVFHSKYFTSVYTVGNASTQLTKLFSDLEAGCSQGFIIPVTSRWARRMCGFNRESFSSLQLLQGADSHFESLDNKLVFKEYCLGKFKVPKRFSHLPVADSKYVVKPRIGSGSKGVKYLDSALPGDRAVLEEKLCSNDFIVEEFVKGVGVGIGGFVKSGKVINFSSHQRLLEWPPSGGSSAYRRFFQSEELESIFEKVARDFDWSGFLMIEAKLTPLGDIYLIEANPRIWGGVHQIMLSTNLPEQLSCLFSGAPVPARAVMQGSNTFSNPLAFLSVIRSSLTRTNSGRSSFFSDKDKVPDVSMFKDPGGWIAQFLGT
jgi:hypothetical protein